MFWLLAIVTTITVLLYTFVVFPDFARMLELWFVITLIITTIYSFIWLLLMSGKCLVEKICLLLRREFF